MYDRHTKKYCFVNLTTHHVCGCRFDTPADALADSLADTNIVQIIITKEICEKITK